MELNPLQAARHESLLTVGDLLEGTCNEIDCKYCHGAALALATILLADSQTHSVTYKLPVVTMWANPGAGVTLDQAGNLYGTAAGRRVLRNIACAPLVMRWRTCA